MIHRILQMVPGSEPFKVFVGVTLVLGTSAIPVILYKTKQGHDFFSSEKPQDIAEAEAKLAKEKYADIVSKNT